MAHQAIVVGGGLAGMSAATAATRRAAAQRNVKVYRWTFEGGPEGIAICS